MINFTISFPGEYIFIELAPDFEITPGSLENLWLETAFACEKYNCRHVLCVSTTIRRKMSFTDAFISAQKISSFVPLLRLAIVVDNYREDEKTRFFKQSAENRGAQVEFFSGRE